MSAPTLVLDWQPLPEAVPPCGLGESPFWHPDQAALYWCDIPGRALHRWHPASGGHRSRALPTEPGSLAPMPDGALLVACRDGLFTLRLDDAAPADAPGAARPPGDGEERRRVAAPPYDPSRQRFNDGKADPQGRFWVGTLVDDRRAADGALYRWDGRRLDRVAGGVTVSNGLAFSPDGRTLLWADTHAHRIDAHDFDAAAGTLGRARVHAAFAPRAAGTALEDYGGRPDGAAVDADGQTWIAMYEGARLVCLGPDGELRHEVPLPVRCPTMPCFGGPDLRTLFVTTARHGRPDDELRRQPWAGRVLAARVERPGLPVNFARALHPPRRRATWPRRAGAGPRATLDETPAAATTRRATRADGSPRS